MKIKLLFWKVCPVFSALLFLAVGCTSDYTQNAMEKARDFALENTRDLTDYQRNHIRYIYPSVWMRTLFEHSPMQLTEYGHVRRNADFKPRKSKRLNYVDLSFAWEQIPGADYTIIVIGHGEQSGNFWEPLKVIRKKHALPDGDYERATSLAQEFVTNNMLTLSRKERVRVRYSEPEVAITTLDLSYAQEETAVPVRKKSASGGWGAYLASLKKEDAGKNGNLSGNTNPPESADGTQFSLIWPSDDPGKVIVISGIAPGTTLAGWKILSGALLARPLLKKYLGKVYISSGDREKAVLTPGAEPAVKSVKEKK